MVVPTIDRRFRRHRRREALPLRAVGLCLALTGAVGVGDLGAETTVQAGVRGRVVDAESGDGLGDAEVFLEGLPAGVSTDRRGRFRFDAVEPGSYLIRVQRLGYESRADSVVVAAGELVEVTRPMGRTPLEMQWNQPTAEINGITGGYTGDGFKTVIPAQASAKISFRLVSDMQPDKIRAAFRAHVEARLPPDATVTFAPHGGSPAVSVPTDGELLRKAAVALKDEWGNEAALIGSGGSIPVAGDFKKTLGLDTLLIGFARDDDRIHSPNEKYDVRSYHKGIRSWLRIIAAFAE